MKDEQQNTTLAISNMQIKTRKNPQITLDKQVWEITSNSFLAGFSR